MKADSCGEVWEKVGYARHVIRTLQLCRVPVGAVMENWHEMDLYERSRPLAGLLLHAWRRTMKKPSPQWIEQCRPEPERGAFRALVDRMQPRRCCDHHHAMDTALKAAWQAPAGRCIVCGAVGTWRQGWPPDAQEQTPCRPTVEGVAAVHYIDLCQRCHLAPTSLGKVEEIMRQRKSTWN